MSPTLSAAVIAAALLVAVAIAAWVVVDNGPSDERACSWSEFRRVGWVRSTSRTDDPSPRQREADLLLRCNLLRGRSQAQVLARLGRPSESYHRNGPESMGGGIVRSARKVPTTFVEGSNSLSVAVTSGGCSSAFGLPKPNARRAWTAPGL